MKREQKIMEMSPKDAASKMVEGKETERSVQPTITGIYFQKILISFPLHLEEICIEKYVNEFHFPEGHLNK